MGRMLKFMLGLSVLIAQPLWAQDENGSAKSRRPLFIEWFQFEDHIYSRSRKTEVGDQTELDAAIRYQYDESTFARFRFETDPEENTLDNKTSKLEFLLNYGIGPLTFQLDLDFNTDDKSDSGNTSGITLGPDLDSEGTFIKYKPFGAFALTFFPYNFDGEVGEEFNTWDVTRLYYVQGAPSAIRDVPLEGETLQEKTIPGIVVSYDEDSFGGYVGAGLATYLYPASPTFDIESNPNSNRWERREDFGYKGGLRYTDENLRILLEHVGHTEAAKTGSLLEHATSLRAKANLSPLFVEGEWTMAKAGSKAYRISDSRRWFQDLTDFQPIYSDLAGDRQDWLGKTDSAYSAKLGFIFKNAIPYISYKYQGQHFVFRERESAHRLRTYDESQSHGGLTRIGVGAYFYLGNFSIKPELEWMKAKNAVFGSSADVRDSRFLSNFDTEDFLLSLKMTYYFGENKVIDL